MGAEVPILVEVEVSTKEWRETYGVIPEDGFYNLELEMNERFTGECKYKREREAND